MKKLIFSDIEPSLDLSRDVFIHPTNSSYGIGASIYNQQGYQDIYEMKKRDQNKPFFITLSDISLISQLAIFDDRIEKYIFDYPQKIFTFILKKGPKLPKYINPDLSTIGIQLASGPLIGISKMCGGCMFGTSANISGDNPIYKSEDIEKIFSPYEDVIFLDMGNLEKNEPSIIIDLSGRKDIILRGSLN